MKPPFKNTYIYFDALNTDMKIPRLDFIQGEYVKITLKQIAFRYTYATEANVVLKGDFYLSPVSSVAMVSNGGIASQSLHYFMDRPSSITGIFPYSFRSSALDEMSIIIQKNVVSGQTVQLKHNIVSLTGGVPTIGGTPTKNAFECVIEITDASE